MKRTHCRLLWLTMLLVEARALSIGRLKRGRRIRIAPHSQNLYPSTDGDWPNDARGYHLFASTVSSEDMTTSNELITEPNLDAMRARAGILRTSILKQQLELQRLERQIVCCSSTSTPSFYNRTFTTFLASYNVLLRKLRRVEDKTGPQNQKWNSVGAFVSHQTRTAGRIVSDLVWKNPRQMQFLVDPDAPTLLPHVPAILARLDRLEVHVSPILERVLNNKRHLASIEPYLDEILERIDDIEPHLPWILENIDVLAPYTGLLLRHIDELLLYADVDEHERTNESNDDDEQYSYANQLLPFLEFYVSRLDVIGPHLPLLRPHVPKLLKKNRIAKVSPHMDALFKRGYLDLNVSANLDVILFYFGWCLNVPYLPRLFFAMPFSARFVSFLARRMPRRFVRGQCSGVTCQVDVDYGESWNKLASKSSSMSSNVATRSVIAVDEQEYM